MRRIAFYLFHLLFFFTSIFQQSFASSSLTAPTLVFPANNTLDYTENLIFFIWEQDNEADLPVTYDLYLGTDGLQLFAGDIGAPTYANDSVVAVVNLNDTDSTVAYYTSYLLPNTTYQWKVIAKDDQGGLSESETWQFTIGDVNIFPPTAPDGPLPIDQSTEVNQVSTLSWKPSTDGDGQQITYDVYLDTSPNPTAKVISRLTDTTYRVPHALTGNTKYYWKVVANDGGDEETSSAIWEFTTQNSPPSSAVLLAPQNEATEVDHLVQFYWQAATDPEEDAVTYELWYGTTILPDKRALTDEVALGLDLATATTYYWKVVAIDSYGDRSESETWRFTTATDVNNSPPTSPTLLFPVGDVTEVVLEPTLLWQLATDADGDAVTYDLYMGSHPDTLALEMEQINETSYDLILSSGQTIYWQIAAHDRQGGVAYSEIQRFTTTASDIAMDLMRVYYRYGHPSLLFEYKRETMRPSFDVTTPNYLIRGSSTIRDAVAIVLDYNNPETVVTIDVPDGLLVDESITYTNGLPNNATRMFKIEGDFSSGPTARVTLQQGVAVRTYELALSVNRPPTKPVLLNPTFEGTDIALTPTFEWGNGDDPEGEDVLYRLLLGPSEDALSPFGFAFDTKTYQNDLTPLEAGRQYAWKIVATDLSAENSESEISYFRTAEPENESLTISYPREVSTYVDTDTELIWSFDTTEPHHYEVFLDVNPEPRRIAENVQTTNYALSGLSHDTKYYWKVIALNDEGIVESSEIRQFITKPAYGNETGRIVDDRDGQIYQWVNINGYKWMTHNLAYEPSEEDGYFGYDYWHTTRDQSKKSYSVVLHENELTDRYGYLYDWNATINPDALTDTSRYIQGICPSGWQVAPREAWNTFFPLDQGTTLHHSSWTVGGREGEWLNQSGLSILPSGYRLRFGETPFEFGNKMQFWFTQSDRIQRSIYYSYNPVRGVLSVSTGFNQAAASVRCVKINPDNNAPTAPTLLAPVLDQTDVSLPVRLEWSAVTDPDGDDITYEVAIDTVASPKRRLGENIRDLFYEMDELSANTTYYWKVRAKDVYGDFSDSETGSFTTRPDATNTAPDSPILLLPAADGTDVAISPTQFTWQAANDTEGDDLRYNFYLGARPEFQALIAKDLTTANYDVDALESGSTYYWKVVAKDGRGGISESVVQSFKTFNRPPTAPELLSPFNGNEGNLIEQTLSWGRSTDPDGDPVSYRLLVGESTDSYLDFGIINGRSRYIFGNAIPNNTTFYWKVIALDGKGGETSSQVWTYKSYNFSGEGSIQSTLISPAHFSTEVSLNPTLEWETTAGNSFVYDVYVNDQLIANNLTTESYTINEFLDQDGLSPHTTYTWTVIGKNVHGTIGQPTPLKEWRFTTVNAPPIPSTLISPLMGEEDVSYNPTLVWTRATDPEGSILITHDLYFDTNPDPTTLVDSNQDTTYLASWLEPNTTYYWKVIATDPYGGESSSEIGSFTVQDNTINSAPSAPELVSPSNFDGQQSSTTLLTWSPSQDIDSDPITYDVYLDTNPTPSALLTSGLTDPQFEVSSLSANTLYYWRVEAKDAQGATTSAVWNFSIQNTLPESPILISPMATAKLTNPTTTLEWNATLDADGEVVTYDIYLDQSLTLNTLISSGSSDLSYTTETLENNTTYYWKVVSKDSQGGVSSSEIRSFSGQNIAPVAPVLSSPTAGQVIGESDVNLTWEPSVDVDNSEDQISYDVYFSADPASLVKRATVLQGTSYIVADLAENTAYYWKVIADDGEGGSASTAAESFTYQSAAGNQTPTAPDLLSPADQASDISGSTVLTWDPSTDPDGDDLSYQLYINQSLITSTSATTYTLPHLAAGQSYTWQVIALDENNNQSESASWQFTTASTVLPTYTVTGEILNSKGDPLVNASLQGFGQSVTTNALGNYTVTLPQNWNGTITPVLTDYTFDPASIPITSLSSNITDQDFVASYTGNYFLSGKVLDADNDPIGNVSMGGFTETVITNASGDFSTTESSGWSGTITPVRQNYSFTPATLDISMLDSDRPDLDFEGQINVFYEVKGTIEDGVGSPLVQVSLFGFPESVTTNASGEFTATVPLGWSGTVRPSLTDYSFQPSSLTFDDVQSDQAEKDFTGTLTVTYTLSGTVTDTNNEPLRNVSITGFDQTVSTRRSGVFTMTVAAGSSGQITPLLEDYTFSPGTRRINNVQADQDDLSFEGTYTGNFTVSGKILDQVNSPLALVNIAGLPSATVTSTSGDFTAEVPAGWDGNLRPELVNYTFTPTQIALSDMQSEKINQNFAATYTGDYGIIGTVVNKAGQPLENVSLLGFNDNVTTDTDGTFKIHLSAGWSGVITPELEDYSFSPQEVNIDQLDSDVSGLQLVGTYIGNYRISGMILNESGEPLPEVLIAGLAEPIFTDTDGNYQLDVPAEWSGSLVPSLDDYAFEPSQITIENTTSNQPDQDFQGRYTGNYTLSGKVVDSQGFPLSQVLIEGLDEPVVTDDQGQFMTAVKAGWTGTITPVFTDYEFVESNFTITALNSDISDVAFEGIYVGTYQLSGRVIDALGTPLSEVALDGLPSAVLTDENGEFSTDVSVDWSGAITPTLLDYSFEPTSVELTEVSDDEAGLDFVATYIGSYFISGEIVNTLGVPAPGIALEGFPTSVTTNASGVYEAEVPAGWSGTIKPTEEKLEFIPTERAFTDVQSDVDDQNFHWSVVSGLSPSTENAIKVFPNPTSSRVEIRLAHSSSSLTEIRILTIQGKVIHQQLSGGVSSAFWDGNDSDGSPVPAGVYICQVRIAELAPIIARVIVLR